MENVLVRHAHATADLVGNFATVNYVMPVVMNMVNAKMAPVCVLLDGTENIAPLKGVQQVVRIMDSVVLAVKVYGNVDATMDGMEPTVPLHWSKIVPITKTMTKVCVCERLC